MLSFFLFAGNRKSSQAWCFGLGNAFGSLRQAEALEPSTTIFCFVFWIEMVTTTALIARVRIGILVAEMESETANTLV
jgi:hypothetical protein